MKTKRSILVALMFVAAYVHGGTLDTIDFGNTTSESFHGLTTGFGPATPNDVVDAGGGTYPSDPSATEPSDVVAGALGQSMRRLFPRTPNPDIYGGEVEFTMAVDPVDQNYFTLKMWGSDPSEGIWLVLDCEGLEVGNRHLNSGGADMLVNSGMGWFADRFVYRTMALPLHLTRGKTSVTLKIRSMGWMSFYDSGAYFGHYQKLMGGPSMGLYRAYTHVGSLLDTSGEIQGVAPAVSSPRTLENESDSINQIKSSVNSSLSALLYATADSLSVGDLSFLAQCYDAKENQGESWITYPNGETAAGLVDQVRAGIDAQVVAQSADSSYVSSQGNGSWGGYFGPMGDAIRLLWPSLSASMDVSVDFGGEYGTTTRRNGWSQALRASIDFGRYNRRTIANQTLAESANIYTANRGLLLVDTDNALYETEALRYLKEACGLMPWLGCDQAGGGPVPVRGLDPYGPDWYMCTTDGTTKDGDGFVGSDYGELGPWVYRLGLLAGDADLQARGIVMTRVRCKFRYPGTDDDGYRDMLGPNTIGVRNNGLPGHEVYLGRGFFDDYLMAAQGAAAIGPDLLGYFQQQINDGQLLHSMPVNPYIPSLYADIKAMSQTGVQLPMTAGEPDFAWVDEENMAVAAKHGENRFFANLYWRQPLEINGLAKILCLGETTARMADVQVEDVRFRPSGESRVSGPELDYNASHAPPDNPINAMNGVPGLIAMRSDLVQVPDVNRDAGRGTGYTLRYGNWLIGINAHHAENYNMLLPAGFTSATNLVSGEVFTAPVVLVPKTSAVFYLPDGGQETVPPSRTLYASALGSGASVLLNWNHAGGADSYTIERATVSGGPYTTIATNVTCNQYIDAMVGNGTTYYYVVVSENAYGASGYSPEASAMPVASQTSGLPAPWSDRDVGSVGVVGSATISGDSYTVAGSGGDIYGTADGFHFLYQPMFGDGEIIARVQSQSSAVNYAKAGVMIRGSLDADAPRAGIYIEPIRRAEFNYRSTTGGSVSVVAYGNPPMIDEPYWVRLVRSGNEFSGYVSPDGIAWTLVGSRSLANIGYAAYIGLCVSSQGSGSLNTAVFSTVTMPSAVAVPSVPVGLAAQSAGNNGIALSWTGSSGAAGYNIKRSAVDGGPYSMIAPGIVGTNFTDTGLSDDTTYCYVVSAVNAHGESADSEQASASTLASPAAPTGLYASATTYDGADLAWTASAGASVYAIKRAEMKGGPYILIGTSASPAFSDTGLAADTIYYYVVSAITVDGAESPASMPALARTASIQRVEAESHNAQSGTQLESCSEGGQDVAFISNNDWCRYDNIDFGGGLEAFFVRVARPSGRPDGRIEVRLDGSSGTLIGSFDVPETGSWQGWETYEIPVSTVSGVHSVYLKFIEVGSSSGSSLFNLNWFQYYRQQDPPSVPAGLSGAPVSSSEIGRSWNSVASASYYRLRRATMSGGPYAVIENALSPTHYIDSGLSAGEVYYYVVSALNGGGESGFSSEVRVVPSALIDASEFAFAGHALSGGTNLSLAVSNSVLGHLYQILATDDLLAPDWHPEGEAVTGSSADILFTVPISETRTNRYFKLDVQRQ